MPYPSSHGPQRSLRTRFILLLTGLIVFGCMGPSFAEATVGQVTEQALFEGIGWLNPHNPLGGNPWDTQVAQLGGYEKNKLFELNEKFESTGYSISGPEHEDGAPTQGSDGNVYFVRQGNTVGFDEPNVIGRLVPGTDSSSFLTLPTAPPSCGLEGPPIPECGLSLAAGPEKTIWYAQFKQNGTEHIAKLGKIAISESELPITQYSLANSETRPQDLIEGGGSRMWFTQKFGFGGWPSATWNVATAILKEGKLNLSEYSIPNKAPGELVRTSGENVFLFQNANENHRIERITPEGKMSEVSAGTGAKPQGPALGPDSRIWFVEEEAKKIGRLTGSTGEITRYSIPNPIGCHPVNIVRGFGENMLVREQCVKGTTRLSEVATK